MLRSRLPEHCVEETRRGYRIEARPCLGRAFPSSSFTMTDPHEAWLTGGVGTPPKVLWSFSTESRLVHLDIAWEADELLAADDAGGLYQCDPSGRLQHLSRVLPGVRHVPISETGDRRAAIYDSKK